MTKFYDPLSMIKKSRFINLFNHYDEKVRQNVLIKIDDLIKELSYKNEKNYGHLCNIFSSMAFYYVLQKNGKTKEESLDIVKNAMYKFIIPQKIKMQKISSIPGFIELMKWSSPLKIKRNNGAGWDIVYPECNKDEYAFTVRKCIYAQIFSLYHVKELGPVFCHVDDILYGNLPKISFEYTQTICRGGSVCDYVFKKKI